jgi:hypothetical protein
VTLPYLTGNPRVSKAGFSSLDMELVEYSSGSGDLLAVTLPRNDHCDLDRVKKRLGLGLAQTGSLPDNRTSRCRAWYRSTCGS